MEKQRRHFCAIAVGVMTSLSGCGAVADVIDEAEDVDEEITPTPTESGASEIENFFPDPEVEELISPESQLVSVDQPDQTTFTVTAQNTGHDGNIAVALFWKMEEDANTPDSVGLLHEGYQRERLQELYFNSGERRTVELTASAPDDAIGFHFVIQPATHGAVITNQGEEGIVDVEHTYTGVSGLERVMEKEEQIDAEETKDVVFNSITDPDTEWNISVQ